MEKIKLDGREIGYTVRHYPRQKRINVHIRGSELLVTSPRRATRAGIERVLKKYEDWILTNIAEDAVPKNVTIEPSTVHFAKKELLAYIEERLEHYNAHYDFLYKRISVREQRSRWGSCSSEGNLTFNIALLGLRRELRDYVIVHELCHLREMNHSPAFWNLVAETEPNYKALRKELKVKSV